MPTKKQTSTCHECGGQMILETRPDVIKYKGRETTIKTKALWCQNCGEAILDADALQKSEEAFLELRAAVQKVLSPKEVQKIRKDVLHLSQREASEMLGGGPRAFQKYESGKQVPSLPMSRLLTLLQNDPKRLKEIRLAAKKDEEAKA